MGKITGFIEFDRVDEKNKAVGERLKDFQEFTIPLTEKNRKNRDPDAWIVAFHFAIAAVLLVI